VGDVVDGLTVKSGDVIVVEGVVDEATFAAGTDETEGAEQAEVMRDGGFALADRRGEVADAELAAGEGGDDAEPGRIGERGEDVGETGEDGAGRESGAGAADRFDVDDAVVADKIGHFGELSGLARSCHRREVPGETTSHD
jgi:hypothetical protein